MSPHKVSLTEKRYKITAAASLLGVSPSTLRGWARRRKITCYQVSKKYQFPESEVRRVLAEGERPRIQACTENSGKVAIQP